MQNSLQERERSANTLQRPLGRVNNCNGRRPWRILLTFHSIMYESIGSGSWPGDTRQKESVRLNTTDA